MSTETFSRVPRHIGVIPDGNRRWALARQLQKQDGYAHGVAPGVRLYELMVEHCVQEATFYGFTKDNTTRPAAQTAAYVAACVESVQALAQRDANILVVGKQSSVFPNELLPYTGERVRCGNGLIDINFLINYDWNWDLLQALEHRGASSKNILDLVASRGISRMDLIIRWGGRIRLSGFLPAQSVYADFYPVEAYWPDFEERHFLDALRWYQDCDVTLGG